MPAGNYRADAEGPITGIQISKLAPLFRSLNASFERVADQVDQQLPELKWNNVRNAKIRGTEYGSSITRSALLVRE